MDDQTIVCDPRLATAILAAVDERTEATTRGGKRNAEKTHASYYATDDDDLKNHDGDWDMSGVRAKATVNTPADALRVLGGTRGGDEAKREAVKEKLRSM
eukprot:15922-Lingulodinium_polyedra.AAC.1